MLIAALVWSLLTVAPTGEASRVVPPRVQNDVTIEYPAELAGEEQPPSGEVVVKFTVGTDGVPTDIAIEQGIAPELDALAAEAVARLRFDPATLDGKAVAVVQRIAIPFEPPPPPKPATEPEVTPAEPKPGGETPPPPEPEAQGPIRIYGQVVEAGQRTPVEAAQVVVIPAPASSKVGKVKKKRYGEIADPKWQRVQATGADGKFAVREVPAGKVRVVVVAPGYERFESIESLPADQSVSVRYYVERLPTNPYRTVVRSRSQREEVARRTITPEEITNLPGTQGDALKSIQNFPGVARAPFGLGLLLIRGTGPNDSAIFLGHHEIPQLFHFGGLTSVFNADILDKIDFVPGNFDSRYGDALGGIIDVTPRAGRRDGLHGYIDSDIFDTGVLLEGPLGKGSFALSARRSYIDFILPRVIPDDAGLDLTLAPRYYDYQALFDYPVGGGMLSVRGFGSDDRLVLVAADPNDVETDDRNQFETTQFFHRVDLVYTKRSGPWRFLVTPSYRYDFLNFGIGDFLDFDLGVHTLSTRAEVERKLSSRASLLIGTEFRTLWFQVAVDAPPLPNNAGGGIGVRQSTRVNGTTVIPALYTTVKLAATPRLTFFPGARVTVYTAPYETATVDPRLRAAVQVAERTTLKGGVGLYSQVPQPVEASEVFGNSRIGPERALQNSLGFEQLFPYEISLDVTGFYNLQFGRTAPSTELVTREDGTTGPENFANVRRGRVYGLEVLLRKQLVGALYGWVAYTLSRSERRDEGDDSFILFDFDQTHILTLIAVYKFPKNWQFGARFRLVSGNPNTPFVGNTLDASTGDYVPIAGAINSERFPAFHQLDLRVDKSFIWRLVKLSLYLDVQNVYNRQNTEFWQYSFDFRSRQPIAGLPIIPSIGTKLEF